MGGFVMLLLMEELREIYFKRNGGDKVELGSLPFVTK